MTSRMSDGLRPASARMVRTPLITPSSGAPDVVSTLVVARPPACSRARSVKVPPISTANRVRSFMPRPAVPPCDQPLRLRTSSVSPFLSARYARIWILERRDDGLAHAHEFCARSFDAHALATDAGALEQQRQSIGEKIGLRDPHFCA